VSALGPHVDVATSSRAVDELLQQGGHDLVVVGPDVDAGVACSIAAGLRLAGSDVGVVLTRRTLGSAVLREAMVAGVREVVLSDDRDMLLDACGRSRELSGQMAARRPGPTEVDSAKGEVVTVFAAKGGCGKTTLSTNLAAAFSRAGRRTCVVDLDLAFGDVAIAMALQPSRTIADALGLSALDASAVRSLVTHHDSGVDAILAPVEPGTAEAISSSLIGELLEILKTMYDVVVVDTPPAFTEHVLAAFDRADHCVLLTTLDVPALKNLKLTLETLDMLSYARERWHVVLNRADAKVGLSAQDVERTLGTKIAVQVPSSRAVPATINRGVPIVLDQPGHVVSLAVRRLAESLTATTGAPRAAAGRRGFSLRGKVRVTA
jgi:pilus assembly protein CpaE